MVPRRLVSLVRSPYLSDLLCRGARVPEAQVVDESVDVGAPYPREKDLRVPEKRRGRRPADGMIERSKAYEGAMSTQSEAEPALRARPLARLHATVDMAKHPLPPASERFRVL